MVEVLGEELVTAYIYIYFAKLSSLVLMTYFAVLPVNFDRMAAPSAQTTVSRLRWIRCTLS